MASDIELALDIAKRAIEVEDDDTMGLDADDIDMVCRALIKLHEAACEWANSDEARREMPLRREGYLLELIGK
jgi:hypothetical protein